MPPTTTNPFTKPTLELFDQMLGQVSVNAGSDDFEETTRRITTAKKQLAKALGKSPPKRAANRAERRAKGKRAG